MEVVFNKNKEKKQQNVCRIRQKVIILQPYQKKTSMKTYNTYYYFYFYFASICEAGSGM